MTSCRALRQALREDGGRGSDAERHSVKSPSAHIPRTDISFSPVPPLHAEMQADYDSWQAIQLPVPKVNRERTTAS
jgi:hypothetical protein